jgi:hypothetical protein
MSDAPAAPVTEQGVPPVTQTEEVPSFKVKLFLIFVRSSLFSSFLPTGLRRKSCVFYHG